MDSDLNAERAGELVGRLLVYAAIIALVVYLVRRAKNKNKKDK